jgi:hypothetical protein
MGSPHSYSDMNRGVLPQLGSFPVVFVKSEQDVPPAAHATRTNNMSTGPQVSVVPDGGSLPQDRHAAARKLRSCNEQNLGFNGRPIISSPQPHTLSTREFYDYGVLAGNEHAYWFCVYSNALPDDVIQESRMSSNVKVRELAWSELSLAELMYVSQSMLGIECIEEHQKAETIGYITDVHFDSDTSSLYFLVRPHGTFRGRDMCKQVEFRAKLGCSLSHARYQDCLQVHELSICQQGARPGTKFICAVLITATYRWGYSPRVFENPPFCIVAEGSAAPRPDSTHTHTRVEADGGGAADTLYIVRHRTFSMEPETPSNEPTSLWKPFTIGSPQYNALVTHLSFAEH